MSVLNYDSLYILDENDRVRIWYMERDGSQYRTVSGLNDGKHVVSAWKQANAKNVGRANATTPEEQAHLEIMAKYRKQIDQGHTYNIKDAGKAQYFEPMLAAKYADQKNIVFPTWSQPKFDGHRCIINVKGMWSREGKPILSCPHIYEELKHLFDIAPETTFDGELYNHEFKHDFNKISSLIKKTVNLTPIILAETAQLAEFHMYDLHLGPDTKTTFRMRTESLRELFHTNHNKFSKIKEAETTYVTNQEHLDALYAKYLEDGYEGQMLRYDTPYEHKRTKNLIKRKEFEDDEFILLDLIEGQGNWAGAAKKAILQMKDGTTSDAGIRGTYPYLAQVLKEKHLYIGKPAKTRYQNFTPDGKLRFGVVIELNRSM